MRGKDTPVGLEHFRSPSPSPKKKRRRRRFFSSFPYMGKGSCGAIGLDRLLLLLSFRSKWYSVRVCGGVGLLKWLMDSPPPLRNTLGFGTFSFRFYYFFKSLALQKLDCFYKVTKMSANPNPSCIFHSQKHSSSRPLTAKSKKAVVFFLRLCVVSVRFPPPPQKKKCHFGGWFQFAVNVKLASLVNFIVFNSHVMPHHMPHRKSYLLIPARTLGLFIIFWPRTFFRIGKYVSKLEIFQPKFSPKKKKPPPFIPNCLNVLAFVDSLISESEGRPALKLSSPQARLFLQFADLLTTSPSGG